MSATFSEFVEAEIMVALNEILFTIQQGRMPVKLGRELLVSAHNTVGKMTPEQEDNPLIRLSSRVQAKMFEHAIELFDDMTGFSAVDPLTTDQVSNILHEMRKAMRE